jgi:bacillithiol biosynthesis cysteine-adding enzyme BshC
VAHRSETTLARGLVRGAIDFRRCSWVRPLVSDYADRFDSLAPLFAGNPSDPAVWRQTIDRVQRSPHDRAAIERIVTDQLDGRGAPAEARQIAHLLARPETVAIVTGQQAGAFGGPLYTVLKAVSAIQLARRIQREHDVPVVPIFWVDAEDHDWEEIRTALTLDADFAVREVSLAEPPGAGEQPVGSLVLDAGVSETLAALNAVLARTEFTTELMTVLERRYRPGATVGSAFAGWIDDLLGRHGLVVFEASERAAKPIVADVFAAEIGAPARTSALVREAGQAMIRLGHAPQVEPADDALNLFYLDAAGRRPIKARDGKCVIGDEVRTTSDLAAEASRHPERFSPNVVLRPIVQDRLFPTVCYIAGPSELAYQAQLGGVYRAFGVEAPLLHSRASATILDSAAARFLERHAIAFESLQAQDESVLNQLLERQLPPSIDRLIHETERHIEGQAAALRDAVKAVDPTLSGAVDTTRDRLKETLHQLHNKIVHASKKKDDTLRRQFRRTRDLAFPAGHPQERALNVVFFANRYGPAFVDRLLEELPLSSACHYLLTI